MPPTVVASASSVFTNTRSPTGVTVLTCKQLWRRWQRVGLAARNQPCRCMHVSCPIGQDRLGGAQCLEAVRQHHAFASCIGALPLQGAPLRHAQPRCAACGQVGPVQEAHGRTSASVKPLCERKDLMGRGGAERADGACTLAFGQTCTGRYGKLHRRFTRCEIRRLLNEATSASFPERQHASQSKQGSKFSPGTCSERTHRPSDCIERGGLRVSHFLLPLSGLQPRRSFQLLPAIQRWRG